MGKTIIMLTVLCLGGGMLLQSPVLALDIVSIPAAALLANDNSISYDTDGVRMEVPGSPLDRVFQAPVQVPHKAVIRKIMLEGKDASVRGYLEVGLRAYKNDNYRELVRVSTSAIEAPGDFRRSEDLKHQVNNSRFTYGLEVVINNGGIRNDVWYYKVVIKYAAP